MKKTAIVAASFLVCGAALAEVQWPVTVRETKTFVQNMPGDAWSRMIAASLSLKFIIGKPIVAIFNPLDEELINVVCDGKWSLVGEAAYNKTKGAPASIAAHTVALVPTDGFDGYCTHSIIGLTETGARYDGNLNIPGDFTNSTSIFFSVKK